MIFPPLKVWVCVALVFLGVLPVAQMARAADTQPPTVTITQPTNGRTVSGIVTVSATATDNVAVANVSLKLDGAPFGSPMLSPPFKLLLNTAGLAKGVHTLLAVATDTAGNTRRSPLVQINITNQPGYQLGSGPFTVTNLGGVISGCSIDREAFFQLSNDTHFICDYIGNYAVTPIQILDVDLSQGTARLTNGVLGRAAPYGFVLYSNGKIYQATCEANGVGYFMEYDPTTGAVRQIAQTTGVWTESCEIGDDGWICIGEYPGALVDRYNPNTDTYERLGSMDTNADYAYSLGADTRYLYVGLGELPWSLAIYDTQTTNITHYFELSPGDPNADTAGSVRHGTNGYWYYMRGIPTPSYHVVWYQLTNGVPVQLSNAPSGLSSLRGNVLDGIKGNLMGYNVNLDYATPYSSTNYATISWQTVGATNWQSVGIGGFILTSYDVFPLCPWDSTHFIGFGFTYGPIFTWDINSHQTTVLGTPPNKDVYDIIGSPPGTAYFSCYPTTVLRYDPSRPWTLATSTTNFFNTNINPYQISLTMGKHNFFEAWGSDGMVYVAAEHERDSVGGELGWYDPVTGMSGSLRTPFTNGIDSPTDLEPALGGTKLVYVPWGDTNLFVFDVATKSIERIIPVSLPGITTLHKVVEVAPGIMFGDAGNAMTSPSPPNAICASNIFTGNITNGSFLYAKTLPNGATAFVLYQDYYNSRLVLGPDGYAWLPITSTNINNQFTEYYIYRINPIDGSSTNVIDMGYYSFSPPDLMFNGGDLYLYGTTNLCRIQGLLIPVGLTQPEAPYVLRTGQ